MPWKRRKKGSKAQKGLRFKTNYNQTKLYRKEGVPSANTVTIAKSDVNKLLLRYKNAKTRRQKVIVKMRLVQAANLARSKGKEEVSQIYESAHKQLVISSKYVPSKIKLVGREKDGIFKEPIKERESITYKEAKKIVDGVAQSTGAKIEIFGGLKRRGYSNNDVDVIVYTDKLPKNANDDKYGLLLLKETRMRVDILFPNTKKERIQRWEQVSPYSQQEEIVGYVKPDYVMVSYHPSRFVKVHDSKTKKPLGVAYLPNWGWVRKKSVLKITELKTNLEKLREERERIISPQARQNSDGTWRKLTPTEEKRYFKLKKEIHKTTAQLEKMGVKNY